MDERIRRTRAARLLWPAALSIVLSLGLAACGGDSPTNAVATLSGDGATSDGTSGSSSSEPLTEEQRQQAMLDFARCMREHGVDMPDPQFEGDGRGSVMIAGKADDGAQPNQDVLDAAQQACEPLIKDVIADAEKNMDPEEVQRMQEEALAFAKCMRDHGIDMPDPQFEGGGRMTQQLHIDPNDPSFQAAQDACASEGNGGRFSVGGPGPSQDTGGN
jgi:hypothetical protein